MDDGDFENLARTRASDNVLRDGAFNITKNPKYDGYQTDVAFMVSKFFEKKRQVVVLIMNLNKIRNCIKN